jgi:hypothetical protein
MDQGKIESIIRNVLAQEVGATKSVNHATNSMHRDEMSPLLKDVRDSVRAKIQGESADVDNSPLLENIKHEVEKLV